MIAGDGDMIAGDGDMIAGDVVGHAVFHHTSSAQQSEFL
jgi:hypothetical protein